MSRGKIEMDRVSPLMNHSRRQLAVGAWSLLVICLGLDMSRLPSWLSPGIVLLVSMISSCSVLLIQETGISKPSLSRGSSWARATIALLIPFAWSILLFDRRSPLFGFALVLTALGPVGTVLLLSSQAKFRPIDQPIAPQADCGRCPGPVQVDEWIPDSTEKLDEAEEEVVEKSVSTVRLSEFGAEPAKKTDSFFESPASDVTQWLTRSHTAEGEIIEGGFRVDFQAGQRDSTIHVSFCPPFSQTPKISTRDLDDANLEIQVAASFPFGARLTVRRSGQTKSSENQNAIRSCRIGFVAVAVSLKKAA